MKRLTILCLALMAVVCRVFAVELPYDRLAPHPRLLLTEGHEAAMRQFVAESPNAKTVHAKLLATADRVLQQSPVERVLTGRRLLSVSREALKRIFYLSYAYRMTGDVRYAQRAEQEMLAVSAFSDWNPSHYLDVGEMLVAVSIGYDWLYEVLAPTTRDLVEQAIYEKGLLPSENEKHTKFFKQHNNWNQVCNAGLIYGALVTMERYPEYNRALIAKCLASNPEGQSAYAPHGGYPEGYSYWEYGTSFEVLLIAGLRTAVGTDVGLANAPGFLASAHFMNYMSAPSGRSYNYYDSGSKVTMMPAKYWFAAEMKDPTVVAVDEQQLKIARCPEDRVLPLYMLYGSQVKLNKLRYPKSDTWHNDGITPTFVYRSGWESPTDTYFAMKGGTPDSHHSHMDGGSFIYEYDGVRWAIELGMHPYHHLEVRKVALWSRRQNSQRWGIFRIGPESHNTLIFNGELHRVKGNAAFTDHRTKGRKRGATIDLTTLFGDAAERVVRHAELDKAGHLMLRDEIRNGAKPTEVVWQMTTRAVPERLDAQTIVLRQEGKTLYLHLTDGSKGVAEILPAYAYKEYEIRDKGVYRVGFRARFDAHETGTLQVRFTPDRPM